MSIPGPLPSPGDPLEPDEIWTVERPSSTPDPDQDNDGDERGVSDDSDDG